MCSAADFDLVLYLFLRRFGRGKGLRDGVGRYRAGAGSGWRLVSGQVVCNGSGFTDLGYAWEMGARDGLGLSSIEGGVDVDLWCV